MLRRIVHADMDAFYASVEQADNPELKGRPVIVGGSRRGVVSAASYEARTYGVRSAMPVFEARRLCPHGIFLPVRMERYKEVSRQVMDIFSLVSPLVEQVSIDEAYIDISGTESLHGPPLALARKIKQSVLEKTSLTCSIGIAPNKFLAKIASDMNKPDGLTMIDERDVSSFLGTLKVSRIPGIGSKTSLLLKEFGVLLASDILKFPQSFWIKRLGKCGAGIYEKALGIDNSPVVPFSEPKSCSAEDTFSVDTDSLPELEKWLLHQAQSVGRELRRDGYRARTITIKVKFQDFRLITRSRSLGEPTDCTNVIFKTAAELLRELKLQTKVRLIGVGVSNMTRGLQQTRLFSDGTTARQEKLDEAMDAIDRRFGKGVLKRGRMLDFDP